MGGYYDEGGGGGNGGFWGDGIWAIIILAMLGFGGGWGGMGFGGGGALNGIVTRADINEGFAFNNISNGITAIQQGICDSTYALSNAMNTGFNSLGMQLANCCCDTRAGLADLKYQMASDTCAIQNTIQHTTRDILENNNANTRAVLDFLTQDKISTLTAENQALRFQASQVAQNQFITQVGSDIVQRLQPPPIPAYVVANPYAGYGYGYGHGYGGNSCGCGC